jgi:replicative DNA helicase
MIAGNGQETVFNRENVQRSTSNFQRQMVIERAPPHSIEAEQGVLGSMLIAPSEAIEEVMDKISTAAFFVPAHAEIFGVICELWEAKKALDLITFTQELGDRGVLERVGGAAFVTALFTVVPAPVLLGYYLEILIDKFQRREVIRFCTELTRRAYEDLESEETKQLLDDGQAAFTNLIQETTVEEASQAIGPAIEAAYDRIVNAYKNRGEPSGLASGFIDLDRMTGGFEPGQVIVIAARPGMGKSAIAMNIAEFVGVERKDDFGDVIRAAKVVHLFSLEMSREELAERLLCSRAEIEIRNARTGMLTKNAPTEKIWPLALQLYPAPIYVDPTPGLKLHELRARMRRARTKHRVELFIVDYLQLLTSVSRRAQESRVAEVGEITRSLKELAKELGVPIILLAQLNREPEKRHYGCPKLSDLRESGDVEQDADIVCLLWRPIEYINRENMADREALAKYLKCKEDEIDKKAQLIVAKHRNGAVGPINLLFEGVFTRFKNVTQKLYSNREDQRQQK